MLWKIEFSMRLQMADEAGGGIPAWVDDEFSPATTGSDMLAAWSVARFAAGAPFQPRSFKREASVGTDRKNPGNVGVTLRTGLVPRESCSLDHRRRYNGSLQTGAGDKDQAG